MKRSFLVISMIVLVVVGFLSCNKEDNEERYLSYATINDATNKVLKTDYSSSILYVEEGIENVPQWVAGKRLVIDYTILRAHESASMLKTYYVKINGVYDVLTKMPVKQSFLDSKARVDSIGHDPINLEDIWFTTNYLNINFSLYRNNPSVKHFINLVVDDTKTTADDVFVELRHNAYFDLQSYYRLGNVSFDVSSFVVAPKTSVKIHLSRLTYSGEMKTDTMTYKLSVLAAPAKYAILQLPIK